MQPAPICRDDLSILLEQFLAEIPHPVVVEDGQVIFELSTARYSVSGDGKCVFHLWSEQRNLVRRVLTAGQQGRCLRLSVLRFGQSQPIAMEICSAADRSSASALRGARQRYRTLLMRVLLREYSGFTLERFSNSADLEHSMSPVYARGLLRAGHAAYAVLGVGSQEMQAAIDGALTFGILWMDHLRTHPIGRAHVEGLKLFLPPGRSEMVRQRIAHLDAELAKWQIYELDERPEICEPIDCSDSGNIVTRLSHAVDPEATRGRFSSSIQRILALAPSAEITVQSPTDVVFRFYGLQFARACLTPSPGSFRSSEAILFGIGPAEYVLDESTEAAFAELVGRITRQRQPHASSSNIFFRLAPERWLESLVTRNITCLDERLDQQFIYSQVPAFAASDRAMLDVLTCTLDGRLAVIELKANEDIHLPLQGLDYWARVRWLQQHGEFRRKGYFPGREISSASPRLFLVTPVLRAHPTTDILLHYVSPRIEWTLLQIDEYWRHGVRVVNRKHPQTPSRLTTEPMNTD